MGMIEMEGASVAQPPPHTFIFKPIIESKPLGIAEGKLPVAIGISIEQVKSGVSVPTRPVFEKPLTTIYNPRLQIDTATLVNRFKIGGGHAPPISI